MNRVRIVLLQAWYSHNLNFKQQFRLASERVQSLIADPYHQLSVSIPQDVDLGDAGYDDISFSCNSLSMRADQLTTSFTE